MPPKSDDDLLKKSLYVYDLPPELLLTLEARQTSSSTEVSQDSPATTAKLIPLEDDTTSKNTTACQLCSTQYESVPEQRQHARSDWHKYNLRQKIRGGKPVTEGEFEGLIGDLDESLSGSGSGSESSEDEDEDGDKDVRERGLETLLARQARINDETEDGPFTGKKRKRGSNKPPLRWFTSDLLPKDTSLGIYRALFTDTERNGSDLVDIVRRKQLRPHPIKRDTQDISNGVPLPSVMTSPSIFMCMVGGGHFAGMVVSLAPKVIKNASRADQRQAFVIAHKTFHRYTTRRKQGGAQSANDNSKGTAHSAGSSLRRYNELALEQEIRALLAEWKGFIAEAQLIFIRATGNSNRRVIFGPYDGQILHANDPRNRSFPFSTRRATQSELMRAFVELTRMKVSHIDQVARAAASAAAQPDTSASTSTTAPTKPPSPPKLSSEDETAILHTTQLHSLVRRSKVPALLSYLTTHALSPNYPFSPLHSSSMAHHTPTPLHLASSLNQPAVITALMVRALADPTVRNAQGKSAFELAGDRPTRDAFRMARHTLGEDKWDWPSANVPTPLSKQALDERDAAEHAEELARREQEMKKLDIEREQASAAAAANTITKSSNKGGTALLRKTAEEKRQEDQRGMTVEQKRMVEREKRARAAEARFKD